MTAGAARAGRSGTWWRTARGRRRRTPGGGRTRRSGRRRRRRGRSGSRGTRRDKVSCCCGHILSLPSAILTGGAGPPKQEMVDNTPSNNASDKKPAAQGNLYSVFSVFPNGCLDMIAVFVFPLVRESRSDVCKLGH